MFDLILRGGEIHDGTGSDGFIGDVAISNGEIAEIGDVGEAGGAETIDVSGLVVSPGFRM